MPGGALNLGTVVPKRGRPRGLEKPRADRGRDWGDVVTSLGLGPLDIAAAGGTPLEPQWEPGPACAWTWPRDTGLRVPVSRSGEEEIDISCRHVLVSVMQDTHRQQW